MKNNLKIIAAGFTMVLITACTTGEKAATPADTTTGQSTSVAPSPSTAPVVSPVLRAPTSPARSTGTTTTPRTVSTERDSAFKPRATVDDKGNIQPINRDTLK